MARKGFWLATAVGTGLVAACGARNSLDAERESGTPDASVAGQTSSGGHGGDATGGAGGSGGSSLVCEPQQATYDTCLACPQDSYLGAFWNGRSCVELLGCGCTGSDCAQGFGSFEQCQAAHASCPSMLCAYSGGQWFPAAAGFCGFRCGAPLPLYCEGPFADCLCPPGATLQAGIGCVVSAECTAADLCTATRGTWHPASECYCGFVCGQPGGCDACLDSCDCGPHRNFLQGQGCVPDGICGPVQAEAICSSTGGSWQSCSSGDPCSCGDYHCGRPNLLDPCVTPGCDCGPSANYIGGIGCMLDGGCWFEELGQGCNGQGSSYSSCRPGLSCCAHCGIMLGCNTCDLPCCATEPGCYDGCPPPPT
jgi:hypothetical protein